MPIETFEVHTPRVHPAAFVHPGAHLIGEVEIGEEASIWPAAVLRGDHGAIRIGARSSIQDGAVVPQWTSRGQYPADAKIDWLQPTPGGGYSVIYRGSENRLDVTPQQVDVYVEGTPYVVTINGDTAVEPGETFTVTLAQASGATIRDGQGVATISNDD